MLFHLSMIFCALLPFFSISGSGPSEGGATSSFRDRRPAETGATRHQMVSANPHGRIQVPVRFRRGAEGMHTTSLVRKLSLKAFSITALSDVMCFFLPNVQLQAYVRQCDQ